MGSVTHLSVMLVSLVAGLEDSSSGSAGMIQSSPGNGSVWSSACSQSNGVIVVSGSGGDLMLLFLLW